MGKGGDGSSVPDNKEVLISGRFYDVSSFKHPGGSVIKFLTGNGGDATETFQEFHQRSKKADKVLKSLPSRVASQKELAKAAKLANLKPGETPNAPATDADVKKFTALSRDYAALRKELEDEGFFKPSISHVVYRVFEVVALFVAGALLINAGEAFSALFFAGMTLFGIAQGRCGWLMHEGGHYSLTGVIKTDKFLQEVIYGVGCGMSGGWWRSQHNKHHATPQKLKHDVDLNTLPLVAFVAEAPGAKSVPRSPLLKAWIKYQAYLFAPVTCVLVGLGWTLMLHPKHALRSKNVVELASMATRYAGVMALFSSKFGVAGAAAIYLATFAIATNYIFLNFAVSHTHLPTTQPDDYLHWVQYAASHTTNIQTSWWCDWWMAYLNFQIEHHLFPSMPQFRHRIVSPRVKTFFEKHGLVYDVRPYFSAMHDTFSNLQHVADELTEGKTDKSQ